MYSNNTTTSTNHNNNYQTIGPDRVHESRAAFVGELPDPSTKSPLFVTWEQQQPQKNASSYNYNSYGYNHNHNRECDCDCDCDCNGYSWEQRGCIGCLEPRLLATGVGDYTLISALRDHRYAPVSLSEVPFLRVRISILFRFEVLPFGHGHDHLCDWTIGVHGVWIRFVVDGEEFGATFLPDVVEGEGRGAANGNENENAPHTDILTKLIRKAGYRKRIHGGVWDTLRVTRYQSTKTTVSYAEYVRHAWEGVDPIREAMPMANANANANEMGASLSESESASPSASSRKAKPQRKNKLLGFLW
eukprot:jgi/Psemu1/190638/e_gw1.103.54.1